ncbi:MBL fold metallo-hydrolase [Amphritea sp.]|uniref:MBL fold metallo-hydrolase n=1 Tax=Amphritea sp. TaxID=1872502 RepID=UPI0025BB1590|nr:MBL fold metallo-hydrolase [Amphritea sp.]
MRNQNFIVSILLSMCLLLTTPLTYADSDEADKSVLEIAANVYSFSLDGGYISMFVVTDEGVMVFETMNSGHAKAMVAAIKKVTDKPIKYAFQSHNHWDHASGGQVLLDAGADTIAHAEAIAWMEANPGRDTVLPQTSWEGNRKDMELGGVKVELHYLGMNHGLGMTVFILPQLNIAYIADIVTPNRIIFSVAPDFNLREWERSLGEILALDFEKAVFSHNELPNPLAGGNKEHVALQLKYIKDLRAAFFAELQQGTNPMLIPKQLKLPEYENWVGYSDWLEMNVWRILADEFMGPFPWRPEPQQTNQ